LPTPEDPEFGGPAGERFKALVTDREKWRTAFQQLLQEELDTLDRVITTLETVERKANEANLHLTISQENLMWAVTDAQKRIRRALDESLAAFWGVPIDAIERKVERVKNQVTLTVVIKEQR